MGSNGVNSVRVLSHKLSNGLYVSGAREQHKDRQVTKTLTTAMPYTGGDIRRSGELGKMFNIPTNSENKSGPIPPSSSSSFRANPPTSRPSSLSGPLNSSDSSSFKSGPQSVRQHVMVGNSGPLPTATTATMRQNSGPLTSHLPATGLITSSSGPLDSSSSFLQAKPTLPVPPLAYHKNHKSVPAPAVVTNLQHGRGGEYSFWQSFPRFILWTVMPIFIIGFIAGGFILGAVQNAVLLIVVASLFVVVILVIIWNSWWGKRSVTAFVASYPDVGLNHAKDGQYVKITGVVTCGSVPLESLYQRVNRCVYTSTALYEYRGFGAKQAEPKHRLFTWGLRFSERRAVDFYISDFQSGLRALVKAGYGSNVTPYLEEATVVNMMKKNTEPDESFVRWLGERNLSNDNRVMKLKEGYIREGSTVTVMGVVQRHENVLMIVSPPEPISTGFQFLKFLLPANLEGLILICEDTSKADIIPV